MIPTSRTEHGRPLRRRAAFSYRGLLIALTAVVALPAIAWSLRPEFPWGTKNAGPMLCRVERKDFIHEVTERGTVASASNVEVRCEVKSRGSSGVQILYIVPEGTYVTPVADWKPADPNKPEEPPDLLVKLDSSSLETELTQQQIVCANSLASMIQAQNVLDTAIISMAEYVSGTYVEAQKELAAAIAVAEENIARAHEYKSYSDLLYSKGYISERELQANTFDVEKKKLDLDKANTALEVLEKYTKPKTQKQLEADIKTGEAKLNAANYSYELDQEELHEIETQIANCTIRAPEPGQVVYANITDRRGGSEVIIEEGAQIRERQVLIKLPDPKRMQVEAKVNEAKVALVVPGLPAVIHLDAFADMELQGEVEKVSKYPATSSFFTANVKEYDAIVRIDPPDAEEIADEEDSDGSGLSSLRPGMTAEVKIRVEQISQVLQVPVQAMMEHGGKYYCVLPDGDGFQAREVKIGSTNDKVVVIQEGLEDGEQVVLNAAAYRNKVTLPDLPAQVAQAQPQSAPGVGLEAGGVAGPSPEATPPAGGDRVAQMLSRLDANGNGQLELDELPESMRSNLAQADTNGDGVIDRQELTDGMARMPAGGGPGRRGSGGEGGPADGSRGNRPDRQGGARGLEGEGPGAERGPRPGGMGAERGPRADGIGGERGPGPGGPGGQP